MIDTKNRICLFFRSFFIQCGWNFEGLQNIGFCYVVSHWLERVWGDEDKLKKSFLRHLEVFNTQPHMSGFIIGNVCSVEEMLSAEEDAARKEKMEAGLKTIKKALASSFASIGDRLIWGRIYPLTTIVCLLMWLGSGFYFWLGAGSSNSKLFVAGGPVFSVFIFAAVSLYFRWKGIGYGYKCAGNVSCGLDLMNWNKTLSRLNFAGFVLCFLISLFSCWEVFEAAFASLPPSWAIFKMLLVVSSFALAPVILKRKRTFLSVTGAVFGFSFVAVLILRVVGVRVLW
mgnify:CR=1 FL=1